MNLDYVIFGGAGLVFVFTIIFVILKGKKASIEIIPESHNYDPGETIKGEIILRFKRSVKSNKLILGLLCERKENVSSSGSRSHKEEVVTLFDFNQLVYGRREYTRPRYSYDFSIIIPLNGTQVLEGVSEALAKSIQDLTGYSNLAQWYLYAELQCDGFKIYKRIPINIL